MSRFAAVLDACVLVPYVVTDTLLTVADREVYKPLWSEKIFEEAQIAIGAIRPDLGEGRIRSRFTAMNDEFPDARVTGWEPLVAGLELPDENDRHVLAAAIRGRADVIVTSNLKDFPDGYLAQFGIEALSPDEFLLDQLDLHPQLVCNAVVQQAANTKRPELTVDALLAGIHRSQMPTFADECRRLLTKHRPEVFE